MKQKLRVFFKKAPYWIGILVFGTILGISLQLTRAWVEPTVSAPGGSIGAPITTGQFDQVKIGGIGVLGNLLESGGFIKSQRYSGYGQSMEISGGDGSGVYLTAHSEPGNPKPLIINNDINPNDPYGIDANIRFRIAGDNKATLDNNGVLTANDFYISSIGKLASELVPHPYYLVNAKHNSTECSAVGGTVYDVGSGKKICRVGRSSCMDGWNLYENWTATIPGRCNVPSEEADRCPPEVISTGSHLFANNSTIESAPKPFSISFYYEKAVCQVNDTGEVCYATRSEVGCY